MRERGAPLIISEGYSIALPHNHTNNRTKEDGYGDGMVTDRQFIADVARFQEEIGVSVVAVRSNHDSMKGADKAVCNAEANGVRLIHGTEVTAKDLTHVLAIGVVEPIKRGLTLEETILTVQDQGGAAIIAHPIMGVITPASAGPIDLKRLVTNGVFPDGIEVMSQGRVKRAEEWMRFNEWLGESLGAYIAGNDSHFGWGDLAPCITLFRGETPKDFMEAIRNRTTIPKEGHKSDVSLGRRLHQQWQSLGILNYHRYIKRDL